MKYIKTFEYYNTSTGNALDYDVGDTVVSTITRITTYDPHDFSANPGLTSGRKYKVLKIYSIPEDKFLGNKFLRVDVEDLETGETLKGFKSTDFKIDIEFDADKYNM